MSAENKNAAGHFYDAVDAADKSEHKKLMIALFMLAYEMDWLDVSDLETSSSSCDDYRIEWMGVELEHGTKEYEIANEMLYMHRHP
jgi:hypothetical protein